MAELTQAQFDELKSGYDKKLAETAKAHEAEKLQLAAQVKTLQEQVNAFGKNTDGSDNPAVKQAMEAAAQAREAQKQIAAQSLKLRMNTLASEKKLDPAKVQTAFDALPEAERNEKALEGIVSSMATAAYIESLEIAAGRRPAPAGAGQANKTYPKGGEGLAERLKDTGRTLDKAFG